jgi:hypothetical protein
MTHLTIQGVGFPPYATQTCTQVLEAVPQGDFVRSLKGDLVFLGHQSTHKYRSTLEGSDANPPAFGALACGQLLTVHCIQRFFEEATGPHACLARPAVPNTLYVVDALGQPVAFEEEIGGQTVNILHWIQDPPVFLSYCPILRMAVLSFSLTSKGEGSSTLWQMMLEEV